MSLAFFKLNSSPFLTLISVVIFCHKGALNANITQPLYVYGRVLTHFASVQKCLQNPTFVVRLLSLKEILCGFWISALCLAQCHYAR